MTFAIDDLVYVIEGEDEPKDTDLRSKARVTSLGGEYADVLFLEDSDLFSVGDIDTVHIKWLESFTAPADDENTTIVNGLLIAAYFVGDTDQAHRFLDLARSLGKIHEK